MVTSGNYAIEATLAAPGHVLTDRYATAGLMLSRAVPEKDQLAHMLQVQLAGRHAEAPHAHGEDDALDVNASGRPEAEP